MRRLLKRAALVVGVALVVLLLALGAGALWVNARLAASLPRLEGELRIPGLSAPVTIDRDGLGVPSVRGANREDVARATGFLHAQERFFQMDLLRRSAAGELAALIGPPLVPTDRAMRIHRFRDSALRNVERAGDENRAVLLAYTEGVNAGLAMLGAVPPEYLALRTTPEPWRPEDTTLVVLAMYVDLQDERGRRESDLGLLHDLLPRPLAEFLAPAGTEWDAPLKGEPLATPPVPAPDVFDLREERSVEGSRTGGEPAEFHRGSNGWAVAGVHTADGGALLANDMHLGLALPNTWYRAELIWSRADADGEHRVSGVTLPGAPPLIAGSNGSVAWGFTNSYGDYSDLVLLETDPNDDDVYLTPDGPRAIEYHRETLGVHQGEDVTVDVPWTIWGPVIDADHRGRRRVLRWVAHDLTALNWGLLRMETARDLDEALEIATRTAIPTLNCMVADGNGRVGWTLMGPIPRRIGFDGRVPVSWSAGDVGWEGYVAPEEYPRIIDPHGGRIWTANNRVVDGAMLERIGDGGYALGARARQIRDGLMALADATARDMLDIQLDDRAVFLERWRDLLLQTLTSDALEDHPRRRELREIVEHDWSGRASIDSAGYRMVRAFRLFLSGQVFDALTARCKAADERFSPLRFSQAEGPLWRLVTERPLHLLNPKFENWEQQLIAAADAVIDAFPQEEGSTLAQRTWGERNTVTLRHPISQAVPLLSRWLDTAARPLPGDSNMPRVQGTRFGASMRMVVSPGRESAGLFHMPGGQSGHPRSPFYLEGHESWARGEPTPFLPGPPVHRLTLLPAAGTGSAFAPRP